TLVHQPQADRAAALARVAAGSHHEPSRFPGLAHLLEHLLFYGGERYQDDDRLMGWVQRQGGSVTVRGGCRRRPAPGQPRDPPAADGPG
ncbi:insulinase family protein, partial [Klebsiella pneumoniae]